MASAPIPAAEGGRRAAERRLAAIDPLRYGATRNHLDGAVTRLSPYIRHGVLTLAEVRVIRLNVRRVTENEIKLAVGGTKTLERRIPIAKAKRHPIA
jgi:deoxyribodipyrimidine photolyase